MKKMTGIVAAVALAAAAPALAEGQLAIVDLTGLTHNDNVGNPVNTIVTLNLGAGAVFNGIYWEGMLYTIGASWVSEARFRFTDSAGNFIVNLTPGVGINAPGQDVFLAGGLKFEDAGLPDVVLADGILNIELFDSFVDNPGAADAIWKDGELRIQYIPAPAALALLGVAGLAGARRRRG